MAGRGRPKALEQARIARSELYKKLIIDAAEHEFARQGFEAARVQQVAGRAALSVGTIYALFASKSELYDAVHQVRGAALVERVASAFQGQPDIIQAVEQGIAHYVKFYTEYPDYLRMQLREGTAWAMLREGEQPGDATRHGGLRMVADLLERGIAEGVFLERDAMRMAKTLTAIHQVELADWLEHGFSEPADELVARLCTMFRRLYCR